MKEFSIEKKIYYHDTDCGNVVYYANYQKFLEEARTEYFASKGISLDKLSKDGSWFAVAKDQLEYKSPGRYHDIIKIFVRIKKIGAAKIEFEQDIRRGAELLVEAITTLVHVGSDFKPSEIPDNIRQALL